MNDRFIVEGGHRLSGEITPQGAKNEALQVICATLLTEDEVRISNIPEILDIMNLIGLLEGMGVSVTRHARGDFSFRADHIDTAYIESDEFVRKCASLRGSVMLAGPILARFGKTWFPKPGGDRIGRRRVDTHIQGFANLGASHTYDSARKAFLLDAGKGLKGSYMLLDEASVTGTANILMAAVLAEGDTIIYNAACEPYVQQLCRMLKKMGAKIDGVGSNLLRITGVGSLRGAEHRVLPDMLEVGSFIGMAAMNRSSITIKDVSHENLGIIPESFRSAGMTFSFRSRRAT